MRDKTRTAGTLTWVVLAVAAGAACALLADRPPLLAAALFALGYVVLVGLAGAARAAYLLLLLGVALAPLNGWLIGGSFTVSDGVLGAAVVTALLSGPRRAPTGPLILPRTYLLGGLLLLMAGSISTIAADTLDLSLAGFAAVILAMTLVPVGYILWNPDERQVATVVLAYVLGQCVNVLASLVEGPDDYVRRYDGITSHYNAFGLAGALALAGLWYLWSARAYPRALLVALAVPVALGVGASGSRSAMLAVLVLVAYAAWLNRVWVALALAGGTAVLVGLLVPLSLATRYPILLPVQRLFGDRSTAPSDDDRARRLREGWEQFLDRPWTGNGFEFMNIAHNIYLQVAVSAGLVAAVGFLMMCWSLATPLWRATGPARWLAAPTLVYLIAGAFSNQISHRYIWVVVAFSLLPRAQAPTELSPSPPPAPPGEPSLADPLESGGTPQHPRQPARR